ncbi:hypothetical protein BASA81_001477 [Batrachochytrium salamandrivorans]|nr:hypothetical protein BASA81_001477 [Batrachochytrium salamandrivorans]
MDAVELAWWLSNDAYTASREAVTPFPELEWMGDVSVPNTLHFARLWRRNGLVLVAFRGTPSSGEGFGVNFMNDLVSLPGEPLRVKVHRGYWETFSPGLPELTRHLNTKCNTSRDQFLVVGHSLGGCMAYLMAFHLAKLGVTSIQVLTFGSPKVGNEEFRATYDALVPRTTLVQNPFDGFTRFPCADYIENNVVGSARRLYSATTGAEQLSAVIGLVDHNKIEPLREYVHVGSVYPNGSWELHPDAHYLENYRPGAGGVPKSLVRAGSSLVAMSVAQSFASWLSKS